MRDGRVVECGPAKALFARPRHPDTQAWLNAGPECWAASPTGAPSGIVASRHGLAFGYRGQPALFTGLDIAGALPPLLDRLQARLALLDRYPAEVSGGEAQRLALVRLLLLDPALFVADEPTWRLNSILQRETIGVLCGLVRDRGVGLVLVSHDVRLVRAATDVVVDLEARRAT